MLKSIIWRSSFILIVLCFIVFAIVQLFFKDQSYFQLFDFQYLITTNISNYFIINVFVAVVAATNMVKLVKDSNTTFFKVFKVSFFPGFIATIVFLSVIYGFFRYYDTESIDLLRTEYLQNGLVDLIQNDGDIKDIDRIKEAIKTPEPLSVFMNKIFLLLFAGNTFFNFSLALMLSLLWKVRKTPSRK